MLSFKHRSQAKELLDGDDIPFEDIKQNLIELNTINTYLGGHKITLAGISRLIKTTKISIAEIGCGGGDNLVAIQKFLSAHKIDSKLIGIDIKNECTAYGSIHHTDIEFVCSDYKKILFDTKPTIVFSSLFCHHFSDEELVEQIVWMKENSTHGFFINDLHRHPFAYFLIKWITRLFSKSHLVKNDAPISVARGFKKREWQQILEKAGIQNYSIQWKWAFRHLIIFTHE